MRYVGLTGLGILYWANVILLRLALTHHCTPAELEAELPTTRVVAPVRVHVAPPLRKGYAGYEYERVLSLEDYRYVRHTPRVGGDDNPLTKSAIVAGMNEARPRIHDCYVEHDVPGTAMVNVVIAKNGKVTSAVVTGRFAGTPTGACVERAVQAARVPRSDGFSTAYPFQLK